MLRRLLDFKLSFFEKGKPLHRMRPLVSALDAFCYEVPVSTKKAPFIRDAVDLKRWMVLVVMAMLPVILMAIWNTGLQKMVYASGNFHLMNEYLAASESFRGYFDFAFSEGRYLTILKEGLFAFIPVMIISYLVGGLCEGIFASLYGHEIAERISCHRDALSVDPSSYYPLLDGCFRNVAFGVIIGKELFGGTGMNILNPALTCRAFLFFTFPGTMTGDVWVGTNPKIVASSLQKMNAEAGLNEIDGYNQATVLQKLTGAVDDVKRIHVDAIASHTIGAKASNYEMIHTHFDQWKKAADVSSDFGSLSLEQLQTFVTAPLEQGGLGLLPGNYAAAHNAAESIYGLGHFTDGNLFWGNMLGSMVKLPLLHAFWEPFFLSGQVWDRGGQWPHLELEPL